MPPPSFTNRRPEQVGIWMWEKEMNFPVLRRTPLLPALCLLGNPHAHVSLGTYEQKCIRFP
jgi:hypothetical protein